MHLSPAARLRRLFVVRLGGVFSGWALATGVAVALFLAFGSWTRFRIGSNSPPLVELTLVTGAQEKGAVCLDGSPPGYHLQRGFESGSDNWVLHLEGGAWCNSIESCSDRAMTHLGSSRYMEEAIEFAGILSNDPLKNPDFYNWNRVLIRYCDGASFSGDVEDGVQNGKVLFFRGLRIWGVVVDELLTKGLANAKQALLTGCSAGGLSTYIHCDDFRARLPQEVLVKCMADAGFFLDAKDVSGKWTMRSFYNEVVQLQNVGKDLPKDCLAKLGPSECFFPAEIVKSINTPLFILNSAYDSWQIQNVLAPNNSDLPHSWQQCRSDIRNCDSNKIEVLQEFRMVLIDALKPVQHNNGMGIFVDSCFVHCQTLSDSLWHSPLSPRIDNKTIAEAVGDWYFNRRELKEIDCSYPCNPSCENLEPDV